MTDPDVRAVGRVPAASVDSQEPWRSYAGEIACIAVAFVWFGLAVAQALSGGNARAIFMAFYPGTLFVTAAFIRLYWGRPVEGREKVVAVAAMVAALVMLLVGFVCFAAID